MLAPLTAACLAVAAQAYRLPVVDLYAMLKVEGGHIGQTVHDANGTDDLGPFQINTAWGPAVARYFAMPVADAIAWVRDDGCANAVVASAILRKCLNETGGDLPRSIGLYHSHSVALAARYQAAVSAAASQLTSGAVTPGNTQLARRMGLIARNGGPA